MRTKHKILSMLLVCSLLAGLLPATAFAADCNSWQDVINAADGELTLNKRDTISGSTDPANPQEYDLTGKTITLNGELIIINHVKLTGGKILRGSAAAPLFDVSGSNASLTLENITLDGNKQASVQADAPLVYIDTKGTVTLDKGSVLTNNKLSSSASGQGSAVTVNGSTLNISGGSITDNESKNDTYGGTIKTYYGATVTMTSGKISNNSGARHGGAIQLSGAKKIPDFDTKQTRFTMSGGVISGNTLGYDGGVGGGVAISNTAVFIMTDGRISGNACGPNGKGGGVAFADENNTAMQISGPAIITGNTKGSAENNLEIGTYANNKLEVTGALTRNIGITRTNSDTSVFTSSGPAVTPADSIICFSSDDKDYKVVKDTTGQQLQLERVLNTITITTQPQSAQVVTAGSVSGSLTVAAEVSDGSAPTYQWYVCDDTNRTNPQAISGQTGASFTIPTALTAGTHYYFCRVSGTDAADVNSDVATVTVQPAPTVTYTVGVSANIAAGGAVAGGGTYDANTSVTVTARPNSGYKFVRWTENGAEVSTNASYTFTATADRALVAVFEEDLSGDPGNTGGTKSPVEHQSPVNHQEIFANVGGNATISVNEPDAASYQWYVDRGNGFMPIEGATGPSYTTSALALEHDGYRYYCITVNANGSSNQSPIFTLRVGALVDIPDTGDNSRLGIFGGLGLTMASLVAFTACKVIWRRKRAN